MKRETILIGSDYILDPWLEKIGTELRGRGYEVMDGPRQNPPKKVEYERKDWPRFFGKTDLILMTTRSVVTSEILASAPRLKGVVFPTIGTESIDLVAASELGIVVANGPTQENFNSMAESTILLILNLLYDLRGTVEILERNLPRPLVMRATMLQGKTLGFVGLGRIAGAVIERLTPWGVRFIAVNKTMNPAKVPPGVVLVSLEEVMQQSDVVSVHTTLTPETHNMIGRRHLAMMKPDAFLVNTARGGIVEEVALLEALEKRSIAGAALDAFEQEPLPVDSRLRTLSNVILTPHLVGHTRETYEAIPGAALQNIEMILRGEPPRYCRNPEVVSAWKVRLKTLHPPSCIGQDA